MLPEDLLIAYQNFTLLAMKKGYVYAAVMIGIEPKSITVIGNVTERGHDLAKLLRAHADLLDEKTDAGMLEPPQPIPSNAS